MLVKISVADVETLRSVAERRGITMTEALRLAIAVEMFVDRAEAAGDVVFVEQRDGTRRPLRPKPRLEHD